MSELLSSVSCLPSSVAELTTDIRKLTTEVIQEKLALRTKQLCQNTDLSSHLVDLMMREVEAIQEELCARRSSEDRKWIFAQLAQLSELITVDAVMNSEYGYKHVKAQEYLNLMMNWAVNDADFSNLLSQWLRAGSTILLRDRILPILGYNNDYLPDFNVMVLLDDIGIGYRDKLTAVAGKPAKKKQGYRSWRTSEVNYVKENYLTKKASVLAKELGRSESAIRDRAYSLGMRKNVFKRLSPTGKNAHNWWTEEQLDFLRENYNTMTVTELAVVMNRSDNSIQCKARDLKLRKDPAFFRRKSKKKSPEGTAALAGSGRIYDV